MKKLFILAAAALMFTACSKDSEVVPSQGKNDNTAIGFQVLNKNMSRATSMESNGHYNFGVWAYKSNDNTHPIMANYLVGFFGNDANPVGYSKAGTTNSTWGTSGNYTDHISLWGYEGLGYKQYDWDDDDNGGTKKYYLTSNTTYMSNYEKQYLRYFDYSSTNTEFFAYAPYINSNSATPAIFDKGTNTITFPSGTMKAGYDDTSLYEYLCAYANVVNTGDNYKNDVQLEFKHMNSRIRIVFYENIAGYDVKMIDLDDDAGIIAVPTTYSAPSTYTYATTLAKEAKATATLGATFSFPKPYGTKFYTGTAGDAIDADIKDKALVFKTPTAAKLLEDKDAAVNSHTPNEYYSATTYYGIPRDGSCGLTFRVSFQLKSTTDEVINVYNAGVHVDASKCVWEAGKNYTYVFKITKNANGTTGPTTPTVDPNPGDKALYPIVFDGITVEDWVNADDIDKDIN